MPSRKEVLFERSWGYNNVLCFQFTWNFPPDIQYYFRIGDVFWGELDIVHDDVQVPQTITRVVPEVPDLTKK
jgi:hypothetical protein